ncbi:hypothetical protein [Acidicapsa acidisoli]|uniref:hypothetical protein n=1 Tax=Acidicapsa acidisoli TaxID=1615681 RepID=UPI0021DFD8C0|nr:hypothetical protein [Acidicapsa acidisoli]
MQVRLGSVLPICLLGLLAVSPGIAATLSDVSQPSIATIGASSDGKASVVGNLPPTGDDALPDAPQAQSSSASTTASTTPAAPVGPQQTKRILFIVPNFRSVSADVKLPPTTSREKLKLFFEDSFDYSAFVEVAILAGLAEDKNSEPEFHGGAPGYARYYWHSFADNVDGNLMTEYAVPVLTREDPRYYTLGHGGFLHRSAYSVSRLFITRNNQGNPTPNFSEIVGNGAAAGVANLYYPGQERTWTKTGQRWVLQVGIDGLSNLVKEFWPNINDKIFHDKY